MTIPPGEPYLLPRRARAGLGRRPAGRELPHKQCRGTAARGRPGGAAEPTGDDPARAASRPSGDCRAEARSQGPSALSRTRPGRPLRAGTGTAASVSSAGLPPLTPVAFPAEPAQAREVTWRQGARVSDAHPPTSLARSLPCGRGPCPAPSSQRCHYPSCSPLTPRPSTDTATAGDGLRSGPVPATLLLHCFFHGRAARRASPAAGSPRGRHE